MAPKKMSLNTLYILYEFTPAVEGSTPPAPTSNTTSSYTIPNTGVESTVSNNYSLLKLSSLSLLVIGTYAAIKKKNDNE